VIKANDLTDLRVGWQRVADEYKMTIFVFSAAPGEWQAVTNKSQGVGGLVETIKPEGGFQEETREDASPIQQDPSI
jgi:hypothetical protein